MPTMRRRAAPPQTAPHDTLAPAKPHAACHMTSLSLEQPRCLSRIARARAQCGGWSGREAGSAASLTGLARSHGTSRDLAIPCMLTQAYIQNSWNFGLKEIRFYGYA